MSQPKWPQNKFMPKGYILLSQESYFHYQLRAKTKDQIYLYLQTGFKRDKTKQNITFEDLKKSQFTRKRYEQECQIKMTITAELKTQGPILSSVYHFTVNTNCSVFKLSS